MIKQCALGIKREYWEYKKLLVLMPILVTALFFIVAMVATWADDRHDLRSFLEHNDKALSVTTQDDDSTHISQAANAKTDSLKVSVESSGNNIEKFWFTGVYLAAAWLASMFYALSSLYNDRRDKSILYWKTMPVSELQTVLTKYTFAVIGFSVVALVISWLSAAVLVSYANLVLPAEILVEDNVGFTFEKLVVWPVLVIFTAVFWCAPVYALVLYVSASARKMPFLTLIVPIIVIRILERIVFKTDYIFGFLSSHTPFNLVSHFSEMDSAAQFLRIYWFDSFGSLALGLLLAALLIWQAAWRRDHHFEL